MTLVPRALVALERRYPGLTVEYREAEAEEVLRWLDAAEIDLVVGSLTRKQRSRQPGTTSACCGGIRCS
jgi:hypothetical protein